MVATINGSLASSVRRAVRSHPCSSRSPCGWPGRPRSVAALGLVALAALLVACSGGGTTTDEVRSTRDGPTPGVIPTIPGGVELGQLDPTAVLVGAGLAFGSPLPSEQVAADGLMSDAAIAAAVARRVYSSEDATHIAHVMVLGLDGARIFDESGLAALVDGAVAAAGRGTPRHITLAGRPAVRASDRVEGVSAVGFLEANLLVIVTAPDTVAAEGVATSQIEARERGEVGSAVPATPLRLAAVDAAFVAVPTVTFAPIPPPEREAPPVAPELPGATAVEGRYAVVAGERRGVVWAFSADVATYASAEALEPPMAALVAGRADGAAPVTTEVADRVVLAATNPAGSPSARVFRHGNLVLLVEGFRPDQLDAITTAWVAALG